MKKLIAFVETRIAPHANRLSRNTVVASLTDSIMVILPLTLVGTVITILSILTEYLPWLPDFSLVSTFSFGLSGLIVSFTFPYFILERRKMQSKRLLAGAAGIGLFLMLCFPSFTDEGGVVFAMDHLGASGIFLGLFAGGVTYLAFLLCSKLSFFRGQDSVPDYVVASFDAFVPVLILMLLGWLIVGYLQIDFFAVLELVLSPVTMLGASYGGLLLYIVGTTLLYFFGISPWVLYGLFYAIQLDGIVQNGAAVAAGLEPVFIHTGETIGAFICQGGMGSTLMLGVLLLLSRSKKLKMIGRATIVPSMMNINEPLVFGVPIMLNPLMFIPFVLNSFASTTVTYLALKLGLVAIPSQVFYAWFLPAPIQAWMCTQDWRSLILCAVVLAVNLAIWYPFWKVFDRQQCESEQAALASGGRPS